jgi:hypothetical protein
MRDLVVAISRSGSRAVQLSCPSCQQLHILTAEVEKRSEPLPGQLWQPPAARRFTCQACFTEARLIFQLIPPGPAD